MTQRSYQWFLSSLVAALLLVFLTGCGHQAGLPANALGNGGSAARAAEPMIQGGVVNAPVPTTGCGKVPPVAPGSTAMDMVVSNHLRRMYLLHVPLGYDSHQLTPLVLNMHGHGEIAIKQERYSQYSALADRDHFLVVY